MGKVIDCVHHRDVVVWKVVVKLRANVLDPLKRVGWKTFYSFLSSPSAKPLLHTFTSCTDVVISRRSVLWHRICGHRTISAPRSWNHAFCSVVTCHRFTVDAYKIWYAITPSTTGRKQDGIKTYTKRVWKSHKRPFSLCQEVICCRYRRRNHGMLEVGDRITGRVLLSGEGFRGVYYLSAWLSLQCAHHPIWHQNLPSEHLLQRWCMRRSARFREMDGVKYHPDGCVEHSEPSSWARYVESFEPRCSIGDGKRKGCLQRYSQTVARHLQ